MTAFPVSIILLAAGLARRMGGPHKLLSEFNGMPLVRRCASAACGSKAKTVVVVTGHRADEISDAIAGLDLRCVYNPHFETGMASSLIAGMAAVDPRSAGLLVMLADMPEVTRHHLDGLIDRFEAEAGHCVVRASAGGQRGNPVILPRDLFPALLRLEGDIGARTLVEAAGLRVVDVDIGPAALNDVNTPDAVRAAGGIVKG